VIQEISMKSQEDASNSFSIGRKRSNASLSHKKKSQIMNYSVD